MDFQGAQCECYDVTVATTCHQPTSWKASLCERALMRVLRALCRSELAFTGCRVLVHSQGRNLIIVFVSFSHFLPKRTTPLHDTTQHQTKPQHNKQPQHHTPHTTHHTYPPHTLPCFVHHPVAFMMIHDELLVAVGEESVKFDSGASSEGSRLAKLPSDKKSQCKAPMCCNWSA